MRAKSPILAAISLVTLGLWPTTGHADEAFFENEVRPVLVEHCYQCHSEESGKRKGGLWLDRKEGWQLGGDSGAAIEPGLPEESLLVHSIRYTDPSLQMPPKTKLSKEEIEVLEKWVSLGAPDPRNASMAGAVRKGSIDYEAARKYWAFRELSSDPKIPAVEENAWPRGDIDRFVLSELELAGLSATKDAEPRRLLRRLYYDLIGLPPTQQEMDAFLADPSPEAYAAVVDALLARQGFGEKWGRHWLDVARYADSNGGDRNFTFYQAWRYRNYVIEAFNADKSYYDFVREQLAGDLLPADDDQARREQLIASTFLTLGPKMLTERDKEKLRLDTADEQIDVVSRAFLGLTVSCARCHDHKFDPISQEDYYAMAGIFRSTQIVNGTRNGCVNVASWVERPLPVEDPKQQAELNRKVERMELAMRLVVETLFMNKAGGKSSLEKLPLAGVLYDDADAELHGDWKESTFSSNRFGAGYVHDDQKGKGTNRAIFRGSLPENGEYEVRIAYNSSGNRAHAVPVTVQGWDGDHQVILNQQKRPSIGGLFEPIGRFNFEKGGRVNVIIETSGTEGEYVIVDAVQFIHVSDIPREAKAIAAMGSESADPLLSMNNGELKKELNKLIDDLADEEVVMAPRDARDSGDIHLRVRGEVGQKGQLVARNFPKALYDGAPPEIDDGMSGRMELAEWITSPDNPLLDRVMANRVWHHLFGRGLVRTVDNFGALGTPPTHPELLDYLAVQLREGKGSIKNLVREIVLSRAYQLSADAPEALMEADVENNLLGRQNRRRLSAEEIRDSLLFLAGDLDRTPGAATAGTGEDLDDPMSYAKDKLRTVYLPVARNNLVAEMEVFDVANPDLVTGARSTTTVPTQALYLLNSPFVREQAEKIATQVLVSYQETEGRIQGLYQTILKRPASSADLERAGQFIREIGEADAYPHLAHVLLASSEFLYLD